MTKCTVTLCDAAFAPIKDTKIDIEAYDPASCVSIDKQANSKIGSSPEVWGAVLTVNSKDIYDAIVDTTGTWFAPNVVENLNGNKTPEIDVILFNTTGATAPKASGPATSTAIQTYVQDRDWSPIVKRAIFSSIRTYSFLRTLPPYQFLELRRHLEELLHSVKINPDLIS
jgi:hypothetical protein